MNLSIVKDKKILLIMPFFFGYEKEIKKLLEKNGAEVYLVFENMNEISFWYRFVYVYCSSKKETVMNAYYEKKLKHVPNDVDYVLVIRGDSLSEYILKLLHERYQDAMFSMYQWDSVANNKNAQEIADYFDKISTFDMKDAETFGWIYRPLFYIEDMCNHECKRNIDLTYICSIHSKRVQIYNDLKHIANENDLNLYTYMFVEKMRYILHRYVKKDKVFAEVDKSVVFHDSLDIKQTNEVYNRSKIIVDYTHPLQSGLTMRTIESVGHGCKLVTNNKNICSTSLYTNNIYVYDENNFSIPKEFIEREYEPLSEEQMKYYSLEGWLSELLCGE